MVGLAPLLLLVMLAAVIGGFYLWARRRGLVAEAGVSGEQPVPRRISLLTEVVAYLGAILIVAGGAVAIGQRWDDISGWGHVAILAGSAAFFLALGVVLHRLEDPALRRLVSVLWFLSVPGFAAAAGFAAHDIYGTTNEVTILVVGVTTTLYAAALWLVRRRALQHVALFAGLVVTICGTIATVTQPTPPSLPFALTLWALGLAWAVLAWQRYIEPLWVGAPLGVILALFAPAIAIAEHGWLYTIAIGSAAAAMAGSIPLRNTPLLALGTIGMFGYVTSMVVRYFGETLGVPFTLAITGVVILVLAAVTAWLLRTTHPHEPRRPRN